MGLDFSNADASWSYSGFGRFRTKLAEEIGVDLHAMSGYTENGLSWDKVDDPIKLLLDHSDCDGILEPHECEAVAPRLIELIKDWDDDDYDKDQAMSLAEGMQDCAKSGEQLIFC